MKHIFIVNPISGNKNAKSLIPIIKDYFKEESMYEIHISEYPGHATEIAAKYQKEDDVCVYCLGGDGSAFEVLNGLNDGVSLAIIPVGSGNDYFRMIMGNQNIDLNKILIDTIEGKEVMIDYGKANDRRFINYASIGLDSQVVEYANSKTKLSWVPHSFVYLLAALKVVFKPTKISFDLTINGETKHYDAVLLGAMNGKYYGGGFTPAPKASIQDGILNVLKVDYVKTLRILRLLPKYFKGDHEHIKEVTVYETTGFEFNSDKEVIYSCDGEVFRDTKLSFSVVQKGQKLRVPTESELK